MLKEKVLSVEGLKTKLSIGLKQRLEKVIRKNLNLFLQEVIFIINYKSYNFSYACYN